MVTEVWPMVLYLLQFRTEPLTFNELHVSQPLV